MTPFWVVWLALSLVATVCIVVDIVRYERLVRARRKVVREDGERPWRKR